MLFNSHAFVFIFLPTFLVGYASLSHCRLKTAAPIFVVLGSLFFYGWWNWHYLLLFGFSIAFNYLWAQALRPRKLAEGKASAAPKGVLAFGIAINLILLGYFKYRNFFLSTVAAVAGKHWTMTSIVLPLAISFFTFEQLTYLVSAWRGEVETHDFLSYALFVTFFPHLIAGPIVRYREIFPQLNRATRFRLSSENLASGLMIFAIGLFKKVIIADGFKTWLDPIFDVATHPGFVAAWAATLGFAFEIYFDFSGYSDMAIGLARMLNVRFPENFDSPYKARSPIEFWRRWHITLSFFLRDYLYIPLGGNRRGKLRQHLNLFATMLLGGLWHGADWTFVLWGMLHGLALSLNHLWREHKAHMPSVLAWVFTFTFVTLAWLLFRAHSVDRAWILFRGMVGLSGFNAGNSSVGPPELRECLCGLFIVLFCPNRQTILSWEWRSDYAYAAVFAVLAGTSLLQMSNPPPFIYFQF